MADRMILKMIAITSMALFGVVVMAIAHAL